MKIILASNSPRRREILKNAGYDFEVRVSDFSETDIKGDPKKTATENAKGKARDVFLKIQAEKGDKNDIAVIGADTVVFIGGKILGKPKSKEEAAVMLKNLSDKTHEVVTGYSIICGEKEITGASFSEVTFNKLSDEIISEYVATGLPMDKAGAYGIQDGFPIVESFTGEFENVMGLPIAEIKKRLKEAGLKRG